MKVILVTYTLSPPGGGCIAPARLGCKAKCQQHPLDRMPMAYSTLGCRLTSYRCNVLRGNAFVVATFLRGDLRQRPLITHITNGVICFWPCNGVVGVACCLAGRAGYLFLFFVMADRSVGYMADEECGLYQRYYKQNNVQGMQY